MAMYDCESYTDRYHRKKSIPTCIVDIPSWAHRNLCVQQTLRTTIWCDVAAMLEQSAFSQNRNYLLGVDFVPNDKSSNRNALRQ